jgi:acetyl esterase/lipase
LIQGGTKEIFLSNFIRHYQALDQAGIEVKLDLYEGMWHVFQALGVMDIPEVVVALGKTAGFLKRTLLSTDSGSGLNGLLSMN